MDVYVDKKENLADAYALCKETIPMMHEIYGEYHPDITVQKVRLFKLTVLVSDNVDEIREVGEDAKKSLMITHGCNHQLYRIFRETLPLD